MPILVYTVRTYRSVISFIITKFIQIDLNDQIDVCYSKFKQIFIKLFIEWERYSNAAGQDLGNKSSLKSNRETPDADVRRFAVLTPSDYLYTVDIDK